MRRINGRFGAVVATAVAATVVMSVATISTAGATSKPKAPNLSGVTLNIGDLGGQTEVLLKDSGALRGAKYKVSWSVFPAGPQAVAALQGGSIDLTLTADTPAIFAQEENIPFKVVAVADPVDAGAEVGIVASKSSGITSLSQLKGKSVASISGTILQYVLIRALNKSGVGYSNVSIDNLSAAEEVSAIQGGSVEAASLIQPYLALAETQDGARLLQSGTGYTKGASFFLASKAALSNSETTAAIADYLRRYATAEAWARKHPSTWAQDYATEYKLPLGVAKTVTAQLLASFVPINSAVYTPTQAEANIFHDVNELARPLNVKSEFTTQFNSLVTSFPQG